MTEDVMINSVQLFVRDVHSTINKSPKFSSNSEAFASELPKSWRHVSSVLHAKLQPHTSVSSVAEGLDVNYHCDVCDFSSINCLHT